MNFNNGVHKSKKRAGSRLLARSCPDNSRLFCFGNSSFGNDCFGFGRKTESDHRILSSADKGSASLAVAVGRNSASEKYPHRKLSANFRHSRYSVRDQLLGGHQSGHSGCIKIYRKKSTLFRDLDKIFLWFFCIFFFFLSFFASLPLRVLPTSWIFLE